MSTDELQIVEARCQRKLIRTDVRNRPQDEPQLPSRPKGPQRYAALLGNEEQEQQPFEVADYAEAQQVARRVAKTLTLKGGECKENGKAGEQAYTEPGQSPLERKTECVANVQVKKAHREPTKRAVQRELRKDKWNKDHVCAA